MTLEEKRKAWQEKHAKKIDAIKEKRAVKEQSRREKILRWREFELRTKKINSLIRNEE